MHDLFDDRISIRNLSYQSFSILSKAKILFLAYTTKLPLRSQPSMEANREEAEVSGLSTIPSLNLLIYNPLTSVPH